MFRKKQALEIYQALHSYKRIKTRDVISALYTDVILSKDLDDFIPLVQTPAGHILTIDPELPDYNHPESPAKTEHIKQSQIKKTCIVGTGIFENKRVAIIGQQMPPNDQERGAYNYGLATADDYILAITMMHYAATHQLPLHTYIDTVGGDPFTLSAKKLQSWLISECIATMISLPVPTISVIIGQGGSGGALALQPADYRLMLDGIGRKNGAFFSVIDPKGCAAILFRNDSDESIADAIEILQPTADYMLRYGIINRIIPELPLHAVDYQTKTIDNINNALRQATQELSALDHTTREQRRREHFMRVGHITNERSRSSTFRKFILGHHTNTRKIQETTDPYIAQIRIHAHQRYGAKGNTDILANTIPRVCDDERDKENLNVIFRHGCHTYIEDGSFEQNFFSCPHCTRPDTIDATHVIEMLFDHSHDSVFNELHPELTIEDIEGWKHLYNYNKQRKRAEERARAKEALVIGYGTIYGLEIAAAIHHFPYMGGAFSAVCGEKIKIITDIAIQKKIPLLIYTATGGMSMWNGTMSLWQMVKTILSLIKMKEAGLPTISILGHPTTGGSFVTAVQSEVLIGERHAEVRFAGRRVVTLSSGGQDIDQDATTTEFFHEQGLLHMVLERRQLKSAIYSILQQRLKHTMTAMSQHTS